MLVHKLSDSHPPTRMASASSPDVLSPLAYARRVDRMRTEGYLIAGAVLLFVGGLLMGLSSLVYPPTPGVTTLDDVRKAFAKDKQREAMFGSGIAVLTSGALMFFGFGLTALIIGHQTRSVAVPDMLPGTKM